MISNSIYTIYRFYIPLILSLLLYFLLRNYTNFDIESDIKLKYSSIIFATLCNFVSLRLCSEYYNWSEKRYIIISSIISIITGYYMHIICDMYHDRSEYLYKIILFTLTLFLFAFISPFIGSKHSEQAIFCHQYKLLSGIFFATFISLILVGIIYFTIFSINILFSIDLSYNAIYNIILFVPIIVSPFLTMLYITNPASLNEKIERPGYLIYSLKYIFVPVLIIYTIILYCYSIKILITYNLPKGKVAYLVSSFGIAGIIIYLISSIIRNEKSLQSLICKNFFKFFIIPLILLHIGIFTRINEFGITLNRYILVCCAIWLTLCSVASFIISEKSKLYKFIFLSFLCLITTMSTDTLGGENLSAWSQNRRLEKLLTKNEILIDEKIIKHNKEISEEEIKNIKSILNYILQKNYTKKLKFWFKDIPEATINNENKKIITSSNILKDFGLNITKKQK